jgi:hypothetical protein
MAFLLDKYYLDLVTDDGTAFVGYVADVAWHGLHLRYTSHLEAAPGALPVDTSALGDPAWPVVTPDGLSWTSAALGLHGTWCGLAPPVERTLLTSAAGAIEWSCLMPRARATVTTATGRVEGLGYVERLRLTLLPWAFPFQTLRWGRHVSADHAVVWIEWDGEESMRAVWLDGVPQPDAHVVATGVAGLSGQRTLRWHEGHDLSRRAVGATIARVAPLLATRVAGRLATMQEHKQLSRSSLVDAGGRALDQGWAIHEVVTW